MRFDSRLLACLVLVLTALSGSAATQELQGDETESAQLVANADELFTVGDLQGAEELYTRALELDETDLAFLNRGWVRFYRARFDGSGSLYESLSDFESALAISPDLTLAIGGRGFALANLGHYADALHDLNAYIDESPDDGRAYVERYRVLAALGRDGEAYRDRARAVELDPDYLYWTEPDPGEELTEEELIILATLGLAWLAVVALVGLVITLSQKGALFAPARGQGLTLLYDGNWRELFRIYLHNVVLTLVTLGVYRFWAKVRNRQFHYQHTIFSGGRLDYHATGKEKFVGFLKGLAILGPPAAGVWVLNRWMSDTTTPELASVLSTWTLLFLIFGLRPLVLVGSQRFNLARTSWNNLRFHFTGRVGEAYRLYLRDFLLLIPTIGIYWSWHVCRVRGFRLSNTRLGGARFKFHGQGGELLGIQVVGLLLSYVTLGIFTPWYFARRHRFFVEHTYLNRKRFVSTLKGSSVLAVAGPGAFLTVLTLGLALPWAITRWRTLLNQTTYYTGEIDVAELESLRASASSTLEGVGEAGEILGEIGDLFGL